MTWVSTGEEQADLPHILRSHSANREVLRGHVQLYRAVMFGPSGLSRGEREAMAVAVSAVNDCHYCVVHHSAALVRETGDQALPEAVVSGQFGELSPRLQALLRYAADLTISPRDVAQADVQSLLDTGLSARDVIDANQVVAYFNYVNRVAKGLGVELEEDEWPPDVRKVRSYDLREMLRRR